MLSPNILYMNRSLEPLP